MKPNTKTPLWETLTMVVAFALLWAWIVERHLTAVNHAVLGSGWKVAQVAAVFALAAIFVIRMRRVSAALREIGRPGTRVPADENGRNGHPHK